MILEGLTDIETGGWLELSLKDGRISMGGGGGRSTGGLSSLHPHPQTVSA